MAKIILSGKSGNSWSENELKAFNIQVETVDAPAFFGVDPLPEPDVSLSILENQILPAGVISKAVRLFFGYLKLASTGEESMVDSFAYYLLSLFRYDEPNRLITQRPELKFMMCGESVYAKPDLVVMLQEEEYLLLVQEDKRSASAGDPEAQLIAEAIAAFYQNNLKRFQDLLPMVDAKIIPGITMVGVSPIFYKIPVTQDLVLAVQKGAHPAEPTLVLKCIPPVPEPDDYVAQGIVPVENRRAVMRCFEAFKQFVTE